MGWKDWKRKLIPREISNPIDDALDWVDDEILDPAGEFVEEEILDPAGEWLGEEIAQPLRRQISQAMPRELNFLSGIGGGKMGAYLMSLATMNPMWIALAAAGGNLAGDYLTTDENVEWDPNYVSAALSGGMEGLASMQGAAGVEGTDFLEGDTLSKADLQGLRDTAAQTADLAEASVNTAAQGTTAMQAAEAQQNLANVMDMIDAGTLNMTTGAAGNLTTGEYLSNLGREFVTGAQPYVDPFNMYGQGSGLEAMRAAGTNPSLFGLGAGPSYADAIKFNTLSSAGYGAAADPGTLAALAGSGDLGFNMATAASAGAALTGTGTKMGIEAGVNYYDAMKKAEQQYEEFLIEQGFTIEQIKAQNKSERISYLIRSMKNWRYSDEEIATALVQNGYISSVEEYDPSLGAETREWGESIYAANGGRIGYFNGTQPQETLPSQGNPYDFQTGGKTDSMGIGNYIETEKLRSRWMDKVERMLQHKKANMQTNDPGLFGRMGNVANIFNNERTWDTREERAFPDMEKRYRQTIQQMERDQANDDWKMMERTKNQVGGYLDMLDNRYANMKKGGRINYNMGTRRTPEGDPISPDVPAGMQMDLRGGGFIPLGTKPRADDVPAMVGLNEFVLNDRAVAGIGKLITGRPDPRAGAKALYDLQNQMEATV